MNYNEIFLQLDDDFSIEDYSQDPVTPYSNGTVKIRVWAKAGVTNALLVGYRLINGTLVPEELLQLVQLDAEESGYNEWSGFVMPDVLGAAAQDGARYFDVRVVLTDLQNPVLNQEAGFTTKEMTQEKPSGLATLSPILNESYAVVLYEEDGVTPLGTIWQYRDTDLAGDPIAASWIDSGLVEVTIYKNAVVQSYTIEAGWIPNPAPIAPTATANILDLIATLNGDIKTLEALLGVDGINFVKTDVKGNYPVRTAPLSTDALYLQGDTSYQLTISKLIELGERQFKGEYANEAAILVDYPNGDPSPEDRTNWYVINVETGTEWKFNQTTTFVWFDTLSPPLTASSDGQVSNTNIFTFLSNLSSTLKDVNADIDAKMKILDDEKEDKSQKGVANGYAPLGADSIVPEVNLPVGTKIKKGFFGSTSGDLPAGVQRVGDYYVCEEDNYTSVVAGQEFNKDDTATYYSTGWIKNDAEDAVKSVNGKTGEVVLKAGDIERESKAESVETSLLNVESDLINLTFEQLTDTPDAAAMLLAKGYNVNVNADGTGLVFGRPNNNSSTSLLDGGLLSGVVGGTTFDIAEAVLVFVDQITDHKNPKTYVVTYPGSTGNTIPGLAVTDISYVSIAYNITTEVFTVNVRTAEESGAIRRQEVSMGRIVHPSRVDILVVSSTPIVTPQPLQQHWDGKNLLDKKEGLIYEGVVGAQSFIKGAGVLTGRGINYVNEEALNPNLLSVPLESPNVFVEVYRKAGGGLVITAPSTVFDPDLYDDGSGALVPFGAPSSKAVNHYIYVGLAGETFIIRGQTVYANLDDAIAARTDGSDVISGISSELLKNGVNTSIVSMTAAALDFSINTQAVFYTPAALGGSGGGGGVGSVTDTNVSITSILNVIAGATQNIVNEKTDKELLGNRFLTLTYNNTSKKYEVTSLYPFGDTYKATLYFVPTDLDPDQPLEITLDGGVSDYFVYFKDAPTKELTVGQIQGNIADVIRSGADVIVNRKFPISEDIIITGKIYSTFGVLDPLDNGSPFFNYINGLTPVQLVENGDDFLANWSAIFSSNSVASGIITNTADGTQTSGRLRHDILTLLSGKEYGITVKYKVTNSDCLSIRLHDGATILRSNPVIDTDYTDTIKFTPSADFPFTLYHFYADAGTANGKEIEVDYIQVIPISNTPIENLTADELSDKFPSYLGYGIIDLDLLAYDFTGENLSDMDYTVLLSQSDVDVTYGDVSKYSATLTWIGAFDFELLTVDVDSNTNYFIEGNVVGDALSYKVEDVSGNLIQTGIISNGFTFNSGSNKQIVISLIRSALTGTATLTETMLSYGTVSSTYRKYNSVTQSFDLIPKSAGNAYDVIEQQSDKWILNKNVDQDINDVVQNEVNWTITINTDTVLFRKILTSSLKYKVPSSNLIVADIELTIGDTNYPKKSTSDASTTDAIAVSIQDSGYLRIKALKTEIDAYSGNPGVYTSAEIEAYLQANDVRFDFEIADDSKPDPIEFDVDGSTLAEIVTTVYQQGLFALDTELKIAINDEAQSVTDRKAIRNLQRQQKLIEDEVTAIQGLIVALQTLKEDLANKASVVDAQPDDVKYPSVKAVKTYTDAQIALLALEITARLKLDGSTPMTGPLNMNNQKINNVATPVLSGDGVNKGYADGLVGMELLEFTFDNLNSAAQALQTEIGGYTAISGYDFIRVTVANVNVDDEAVSDQLFAIQSIMVKPSELYNVDDRYWREISDPGQYDYTADAGIEEADPSYLPDPDTVPAGSFGKVTSSLGDKFYVVDTYDINGITCIYHETSAVAGASNEASINLARSIVTREGNDLQYAMAGNSNVNQKIQMKVYGINL